MTAPGNTTDENLLRQMTAGDEGAFSEIYRRHQPGVFRFALHMSGSVSIAEDVTQETFMMLIRESHKYQPSRGSLSSFLFGVARNHVMRNLNRDHFHVPIDNVLENMLGSSVITASLDLMENINREQALECLQKAILSLPHHYREVVILCELNEKSYSEAAAILSCSVGTIRSRLNRARGMLVQKLRRNRPDLSDFEETETRRCYI